jgi:hypothetical protein
MTLAIPCNVSNMMGAEMRPVQHPAGHPRFSAYRAGKEQEISSLVYARHAVAWWGSHEGVFGRHPTHTYTQTPHREAFSFQREADYPPKR